MIKKAGLALAVTLILLSGCKKEDKAPQVKESREPKTSYGQAVAQAKKAASATEDAQKREMQEALGDDDAGASKE